MKIFVIVVMNECLFLHFKERLSGRTICSIYICTVLDEERRRSAASLADVIIEWRMIYLSFEQRSRDMHATVGHLSNLRMWSEVTGKGSGCPTPRWKHTYASSQLLQALRCKSSTSATYSWRHKAAELRSYDRAYYSLFRKTTAVLNVTNDNYWFVFRR